MRCKGGRAAAGLTVRHDLPRGTIRAKADVGHLEVGYVDELTSRMPSPEEARTLALASGVPVMVYVRTAWTNERPVRVTRTIFPADRNRVVYELGDLSAYDGNLRPHEFTGSMSGARLISPGVTKVPSDLE